MTRTKKNTKKKNKPSMAQLVAQKSPKHLRKGSNLADVNEELYRHGSSMKEIMNKLHCANKNKFDWNAFQKKVFHGKKNAGVRLKGGMAKYWSKAGVGPYETLKSIKDQKNKCFLVKVPTLRQKCISSGCKGNTRNYCLLHGALCPKCWAKTHFVYTKVCPVRKQQ